MFHSVIILKFIRLFIENIYNLKRSNWEEKNVLILLIDNIHPEV